MPESRIVIAGGGFAGLYTALELEKLFSRDDDVSVTLLNDVNFFLFTPMTSSGPRPVTHTLQRFEDQAIRFQIDS